MSSSNSSHSKQTLGSASLKSSFDAPGPAKLSSGSSKSAKKADDWKSSDWNEIGDGWNDDDWGSPFDSGFHLFFLS